MSGNVIVQNGSGVRLKNRINSPKKGGTSDIDSKPYLIDLGIEITSNQQSIQFTPNSSELVHNWSPYVQGFSANFVQSQIDKYEESYSSISIHDPFAGSGTVLVQSKLNGIPSSGTELNPLLQFIANSKMSSWNLAPNFLMDTYERLPKGKKIDAPDFLKSEKHFKPKILKNLELLKGRIFSFTPMTDDEQIALNLIKVAFASILIDCSNLKRSPSLGYVNKDLADDTPYTLIKNKLSQISSDLVALQENYAESIPVLCEVFTANARDYLHQNQYDLVITSPPYMNGMDYVINYKIEMAWLDFADDQKSLKAIKDDMVVCDNVSRGLIRNFSLEKDTFYDEWLEDIKESIKYNIEKRGTYRRVDMPYIVHKYFDDMYNIMANIIPHINKNGRFILVVGDSLIADTYLPTDLLIAKIGNKLGMEIEGIEKARGRRSGQVRSYKLRETIVTLRKIN